MVILIVLVSILSTLISLVQYLSKLPGAAHVLCATVQRFNLSKYEDLSYS
jgi:hypothetical protein